jgi:predicted dinucleotide-binding enzyme
MTESQWVAQQLGRPVVKAFNTIHAQHLFERGRAADQSGRIALPIAGDDPAAKEVVLRLIDELGFDGVDAGTLDESWRQQPGAPVYGADMNLDSIQGGLMAARRERSADFRAPAASHHN